MQNSVQHYYLPESYAQVSPFLTKMSKNCCTHQVWTVHPPPSPFIRLKLYEKSREWGEILAYSQNFTNFSHQKDRP